MPASAATEFISIIDPDNGAGTDYSSLNAWEQWVQADLATSSTKVFSYGTASGTVPDNVTVQGQTSGATATLVHQTASTTSAQIMLKSISGTFQSGEQVYRQSTGASSTYIFLSNTGDSAIAVASCRSTNGTADQTAVTISGWTTASTTYIKIWTDPTTGARHNGKWDDGKYRLSAPATAITIMENDVRVDGLQIAISGDWDGGIYIGYGLTNSAAREYFSNNIIKGAANDSYNEDGIYLDMVGGGSQVKIWNNIIYDIGKNAGSNGITAYGAYAYVYNNTLNNSGGIDVSTAVALNNISEGYWGTFDSPSDYNISSDGTPPGSHSKSSTTVSFIDAVNKDFHLSPTDTAAKDAGTSTPLWDANLSFHDDINGTARGGAWDIGADEVSTEFISTIGETTGEYHSLSAWEAAVNDQYLTNDARRIFSGTASGTLNVDDPVTLVRSGVDLGITGYVKATTSNQIFIRTITGTSTPVVAQSGDQWVLTAANLWTITGTGDQLGASPAVVAKITGSWTNAETATVIIDGWETSYDNYIKIYTDSSARHNGKWDVTKYRIDVAASFGIENNENYVRIDGIQVDSRDTSSAAIENRDADILIGTDIRISNNILWGNSGTWSSGVMTGNSTRYTKMRVWNNIIYDWLGGDAHGIVVPTELATSSTAYIYNNTIYNCRVGIGVEKSVVYATNNLVQNSTTDGYEGTYATSSDYNISDRAGDAPNLTFATTSKTAVFTAATTDDFHLADTDTAAKGAGVNLYNDANINVVNDIDSAGRPSTGSGQATGVAWDIGADQTAVKIYRSIAPSATGALTTGASNAMTISSSTSLATFATALADNIGVGDVIIYNTGGTATATVFIHGRSSSTVYTVKTASGTNPTAVSGDSTWSIYRAYTTLANAEAGTENTGIVNASIRNFDAWSGGADLVASNTQMNIAAYANGTTADTAVVIDGWMTGVQNYIKIYTPTQSSEVGTSQRHQGKWDEGKYRIEATNNNVIGIDESYAKIEGLQIKLTMVGSNYQSGIVLLEGSRGDVYLSSNIIRGDIDGTSYNAYGIRTLFESGSALNVWNNIIYDFNNNGNGLFSYFKLTAYNNSIINTDTAFWGADSGGTLILANNIAQCNYICYELNSGSFDSNDNYNISSDMTAPGVNSKSSTTVSFVDSANKDFHLAPSDIAALDAGTSTASDTNLSVTDDIDGNFRHTPDIGADEGSVEYVTSVMESGGNFSTLSSWEAANQVDLATTSTAVFSLSSASGTIPANASVMGLTSGAVASTTVGSVSTSTQILLYNIPSTSSGQGASSSFLSGERIYIRGGATTSNYAILANAGNPAIATAKIDGAWINPATTDITFDGWTTAPSNYMRIYTTSSARHDGKWSNTKYRIVSNGEYIMMVREEYIRFDGLQLEGTRTGAEGSVHGIMLAHYELLNGTAKSDVRLSSNIFKGNYDGVSVNASNGFRVEWPSNVIFENNIAYGWKSGFSRIMLSQNGVAQLYNNTAVNNTQYGFNLYWGYPGGTINIYGKNNLATGNGTDFYFFGQSATTDWQNNLSGDTTSPNTEYRNKTVQFVDATNKDYHLSPTDTAAKDAGVDLSTSTTSPFYTDIDGQSRGSSATSTAGGLGWDIGADEGATIIYRSVGNTSATLGIGDTLTIASTTATFSAPQPDNIGVGDVIQYGSPLTLAFITGRSSSTVYSVVNATGTYPVATTSVSASIYRAHTLLNNWQTQTTGTVNQSINAGLRSQILVARDLVASNTAMFVAAYASSSPDTNRVDIDTWTTGAGNYIKVYTPVTASEVGISQRHTGKWDTSKYNLSYGTLDWRGVLTISTANVVIDGFQVEHTNSSPSARFGISSSQSNVTIANNIIRLPSANGLTDECGITNAGAQSINIYNNIVYDWGTGINGANIITAGTIVNIYNNTVVDYTTTGITCWGYPASSTYFNLKNNIVQGSGNDSYQFDFGGNVQTTYAVNISSDATSPNSGGTDCGGHSCRNQTVSFVDAANGDFHLAPTDAAARDAGVDLSGDVWIPAFAGMTGVGVDIEGDARPAGPAWDIGADEDVDSTPDFLFKGKAKFKGKIKFND